MRGKPTPKPEPPRPGFDGFPDDPKSWGLPIIHVEVDGDVTWNNMVRILHSANTGILHAMGHDQMNIRSVVEACARQVYQPECVWTDYPDTRILSEFGDSYDSPWGLLVMWASAEGMPVESYVIQLSERKGRWSEMSTRDVTAHMIQFMLMKVMRKPNHRVMVTALAEPDGTHSGFTAEFSRAEPCVYEPLPEILPS